LTQNHTRAATHALLLLYAGRTNLSICRELFSEQELMECAGMAAGMVEWVKNLLQARQRPFVTILSLSPGSSSSSSSCCCLCFCGGGDGGGGGGGVVVTPLEAA
jgi:uncharacterized membrane protein